MQADCRAQAECNAGHRGAGNVMESVGQPLKTDCHAISHVNQESHQVWSPWAVWRRNCACRLASPVHEGWDNFFAPVNPTERVLTEQALVRGCP